MICLISLGRLVGNIVNPVRESALLLTRQRTSSIVECMMNGRKIKGRTTSTFNPYCLPVIQRCFRLSLLTDSDTNFHHFSRLSVISVGNSLVVSEQLLFHRHHLSTSRFVENSPASGRAFVSDYPNHRQRFPSPFLERFVGVRVCYSSRFSEGLIGKAEIVPAISVNDENDSENADGQDAGSQAGILCVGIAAVVINHLEESYESLENENVEEAAIALRRAVAIVRDEKDPFAFLHFLEKIDRSFLERLVAQTQEAEFKLLLDQKDAVRLVFEKWLKKINRASPQTKNPECFICFALEREVGQWLEQTFVPDLDLVGVKPLFCFRDLVVGKDLNAFQALARTADLLAIICTPTIKQKCEERALAPIGVAQELRIATERFNDLEKHETMFPIYIKGDRRSACPSVFIEPIFGAKLNVEGNILSYYSHAFELFGAMRQLPRETARKMKAAFLEDCREVLAGDIDSNKLEMWRGQRLAKKGFLKKAIEERVRSKIRMNTCPLVPNNFTGRQEELDALHQRCQAQKRLAISGLGGMGKTALALKYAEQYQSHYQFIHFIYGSTPQLMTEGFLKLSDDFKVLGDNAEERLMELKHQLDQLESDYLLIIDGVDDPTVFEELDRLLPNRGKCFLLTSRMSHRAKNLNFEVIDLTPLKREEAIDYLVHVTKNDDREGAARLAERLGDLPLALTHAAAYIQESGQSFDTYLIEFKENELRLFEDTSLTLKPGEGTILTTWKISLDAIKKEIGSDVASEILNFFSFLGQTPIPMELTRRWFRNRFPSHPDLELTRAMRLLRNYSMIGSSTPDTHDIHPLVQEVTRFQLLPMKQQEILQQGLQTFCDLTAGLDLSILRARRSLDVIIPHQEKFIQYIPEHFPNEVSLINILQVLWHYDDCDGKYKNAEAVARLYLGRCQSKSIDQATALSFLGSSLSQMGHYQEALKYQMQALELKKELLGERNPDVATSLNNMGTTYGELGNHQEALKYGIQALELFKELLGEKHPDVATSLNNVGSTLGELGNHQEALRYLVQALELSKELLGEKHPNVATNLNNVGLAYGVLGNYQEALKYGIQALELSKELLGEKHPAVVASLNSVGGAYWTLGNYQEALKYGIQALELSKELLGEKHPDVARSLNNVGMTYGELGNHQEALKYQMQALELKKEQLGEKHPAVAESLNNVGMTYGELGNHQEALKYLVQALGLRKELLGEKHLAVAKGLNNVGLTYGALGNQQEALRYKMQAVELFKELLGEKHPDVATSLNNVGGTYGALGNYQEALRYQIQALELRKELLGEKHPAVATSLNNVGVTYGDLGNHQEALKYEMQALELRKELLGEKHPDVATSLNNVGLTLGQLEKHQEALGYLTESFKILCAVFDQKHPRHLIVLKNLIAYLNSQTNIELVQKTKQEILPLAIEKLGREHPLVEALQKI